MEQLHLILGLLSYVSLGFNDHIHALLVRKATVIEIQICSNRIGLLKRNMEREVMLILDMNKLW